jgi:hypothetical protein
MPCKLIAQCCMAGDTRGKEKSHVEEGWQQDQGAGEETRDGKQGAEEEMRLPADVVSSQCHPEAEAGGSYL